MSKRSGPRLVSSKVADRRSAAVEFRVLDRPHVGEVPASATNLLQSKYRQTFLSIFAQNLTVADKAGDAVRGFYMAASTSTSMSLCARKRAEAKRIREIAEHLPAVLAAQIRRDAAALEIEADGLQRGGRSTAAAARST